MRRRALAMKVVMPMEMAVVVGYDAETVGRNAWSGDARGNVVKTEAVQEWESGQAVVAHTLNPSTREAEATGSLRV